MILIFKYQLNEALLKPFRVNLKLKFIFSVIKIQAFLLNGIKLSLRREKPFLFK